MKRLLWSFVDAVKSIVSCSSSNRRDRERGKHNGRRSHNHRHHHQRQQYSSEDESPPRPRHRHHHHHRHYHHRQHQYYFSDEESPPSPRHRRLRHRYQSPPPRPRELGRWSDEERNVYQDGDIDIIDGNHSFSDGSPLLPRNRGHDETSSDTYSPITENTVLWNDLGIENETQRAGHREAYTDVRYNTGLKKPLLMHKRERRDARSSPPPSLPPMPTTQWTTTFIPVNNRDKGTTKSGSDADYENKQSDATEWADWEDQGREKREKQDSAASKPLENPFSDSAQCSGSESAGAESKHVDAGNELTHISTEENHMPIPPPAPPPPPPPRRRRPPPPPPRATARPRQVRSISPMTRPQPESRPLRRDGHNNGGDESEDRRVRRRRRELREGRIVGSLKSMYRGAESEPGYQRGESWEMGAERERRERWEARARRQQRNDNRSHGRGGRRYFYPEHV